MNIVLQPDAAPARKIDPRLHRDYRAGGQRASAVRARRGASWTSSPIPWPSEWPNASSYPAPAMTSRANASACAPVRPGPDRLASDALRPLHDLVDLPLPGIRRGADDHRTGQIGTVALELGAESSRSHSPFPIARAVERACGRALRGPEATMV